MERKIKGKRIVIKIGTTTLSDTEGFLDEQFVTSLVNDISALHKEDREIVLVTSGAIGAGCAELGIKSRLQEIEMRQAAAAIGQNVLMQEYHTAFKKHNTNVAQLLITYDDFSDRTTYLNLRNCLNRLLKLGVVPIVNENDPISIKEIGPSFGDNDRLSALVASKLDADLLIILTDVDALYTDNPTENPNAKKIPYVKEITEEIEKSCKGTGSTFAQGGMKGKIAAAKVCVDVGVAVVICKGREPEILKNILSGKEVGTFFEPHERKNSKDRWILEAKPKGTVSIDEGAVRALQNGSNLLPAGITAVEGQFQKGDIVKIANGEDIARAIVEHSSDALRKLRGLQMTNSTQRKEYEVIRAKNIVFL